MDVSIKSIIEIINVVFVNEGFSVIDAQVGFIWKALHFQSVPVQPDECLASGKLGVVRIEVRIRVFILLNAINCVEREQ